MAGDPKQLPPTVIRPRAFDFALDVTLFDRISNNGVAPLLLDTQVDVYISLTHGSHLFMLYVGKEGRHTIPD